MNTSSPLTRARRIVVKVGSALLVDQSTGQVNRPWLESLVEDLLRLRARKQEVVLVSSGAIALGRRELKLATGPLKLEESQAAAAVGQIALAHIYKELFAALRRHRRPDSVNARRQRAPAPLSQCPRHAVRAARARCTAGDQRKRHGGHHRDPLRRQRSAGGASRADDQRRLPAAAVGRVGPVHRRSQPRSDGAAHPRDPRHHARDRSHGRWLGIGGGLGRHGHQDRGGEDRHRRRLRHGHRRRRAAASGAPPRRGRRVQLVPAGVRIRRTRASSGSPDRCARAAPSPSTPAPCRRCARARACCPPASPRSAAGSRAATP